MQQRRIVLSFSFTHAACPKSNITSLILGKQLQDASERAADIYGHVQQCLEHIAQQEIQRRLLQVSHSPPQAWWDSYWQITAKIHHRVHEPVDIFADLASLKNILKEEDLSEYELTGQLPLRKVVTYGCDLYKAASSLQAITLMLDALPTQELIEQWQNDLERSGKLQGQKHYYAQDIQNMLDVRKHMPQVLASISRQMLSRIYNHDDWEKRNIKALPEKIHDLLTKIMPEHMPIQQDHVLQLLEKDTTIEHLERLHALLGALQKTSTYFQTEANIWSPFYFDCLWHRAAKNDAGRLRELQNNSIYQRFIKSVLYRDEHGDKNYRSLWVDSFIVPSSFQDGITAPFSGLTTPALWAGLARDGQYDIREIKFDMDKIKQTDLKQYACKALLKIVNQCEKLYISPEVQPPVACAILKAADPKRLKALTLDNNTCPNYKHHLKRFPQTSIKSRISTSGYDMEQPNNIGPYNIVTFPNIVVFPNPAAPMTNLLETIPELEINEQID